MKFLLDLYPAVAKDLYSQKAGFKTALSYNFEATMQEKNEPVRTVLTNGRLGLYGITIFMEGSPLWLLQDRKSFDRPASTPVIICP
jgi:hypothetical protein